MDLFGDDPQPIVITDDVEEELELARKMSGFAASGALEQLREIADSDTGKKCGVNVATTSPNSTTPLISAVAFRRTEVVAFLLSRGADPNFETEGRTATATLLDKGTQTTMDSVKTEILSMLAAECKRRGVALNHDKRITATLLLTLKSGDLQTIKTFFATMRIDPNQRLESGKTPFLIALDSSNIELIKVLVQLGDSQRMSLITYQNGLTPFQAVVQRNLKEIAEVLTAHSLLFLSATSTVGNNALHFACGAPIRDADWWVDFILTTGRTIVPELIGGRSEDGNTPLHNALRANRVKITERLLREKPDVNARAFSDGKTPFMLAFSVGESPNLENKHAPPVCVLISIKTQTRNSFARCSQITAQMRLSSLAGVTRPSFLPVRPTSRTLLSS